MKGSWVDPKTLTECDQMRFIFQHRPPCSSNTSINSEVLESNR